MAPRRPINIKVRFGTETVTLRDHTQRVKTALGVEIYILQRPGNGYQPMADIPDGTLEKYKHTRPVLVKCEWVEL